MRKPMNENDIKAINEYEAAAIRNEDKQLKYYTDKDNLKQETDRQDSYIVNLSIKEIAYNLSQTIIDIINELVETNDYTLNNIITIFFKGDRMIYLGITLMLISLAYWIIEST